jgi:hypothetical protein
MSIKINSLRLFCFINSGNKRIFLLTLVFFLFLLINSNQPIYSNTPDATKEKDDILKSYRWLMDQQDVKTGLIHSYDMPGDSSALTYDQAVAIITLLAVGETETACRCADAILCLRDKKLKAWADIYDSNTKKVLAKPIAVGPNAWMGIALLKLYLATNQKKYLSAAEEVSEFMLKLQVKDGKRAGSVPGGYDRSGKLSNWTSTEHNADFVAFMAGLSDVTGKENYSKAALSAARWLDREMWDPNFKCYYPGYLDNNNLTPQYLPERLDSQTWTILALHAASKTKCGKEIFNLMHNGLPWIDQYLCTVYYEDANLVGFSKITLGCRATPSFWAEGTAGYILAARLIGRNKENLRLTSDSLRSLGRPDGSVPHSVGIAFPDITAQFEPGDVLIAHFEGIKNCLLGQVGVYGDGEPDLVKTLNAGYREPYSWYYEPEKPGYEKENVHTGVQSFRLVNATKMCKSTNKDWASLGIDLGPVSESGICIKPFDAGAFRKFVFWAKTQTDTHTAVKVLFRDVHAKNFLPQAAISTTPEQIIRSWRRYEIDLDELRQKIDLEKLVHIGLAFGKDVGNPPGTIIYVDDFAFVGAKNLTNVPAKQTIPTVYPQHWPYGSIAAAAWFIFVELDINPFSLKSASN